MKKLQFKQLSMSNMPHRVSSHQDSRTTNSSSLKKTSTQISEVALLAEERRKDRMKVLQR